jgi:WD40 repeat protein
MRLPDDSLRDSPYKGLMPYTEDDTAYFFGREAFQQVVTDNLMAARLTLLYGSSGVGKSSVLRAGVVYPLRQMAKQNLEKYGTPEFAVIYFNSWRDDPLMGLLQQVKADITRLLGDIQLEPVPQSGQLDQILETWVDRIGGEEGGAELFIILDQVEEYFLYHPQSNGDDPFAIEFSRSLNRPDLRVNFLISIREDCYINLDRFKGRIPNLFNNYLRLEHLDRESAQAAILKPVEEYNRQHHTSITVEPELVEAVLDQVRVGQVTWGETGRGSIQQPDTPTESRIDTPYLQLVMTRLWHEEVDKGASCLQLKTLTRLGNAQAIAWDHMKKQIDALTPTEKKAAAAVFQYLVTPGGTKIAYPVLELTKDTGLDKTALITLLEKLASGRQRIVRPVGPSPGKPDVQRYEIFHDVLAQPVLEWRSQYLARQRENRKQRRVIGILAGSGIGISVFLGLADYRTKVDRLTDKAIQLPLKFEAGQQLVALQEALQTGKSVQRLVQNFYPLNLFLGRKKDQAIGHATSALLSMLSRIQEQNQFSFPSGQVVSLSPDWQMVATDDGTVQVRELQTGAERAKLPAAGPVLDLHWDGKTLVMVFADRKIQRWDWQTGKPQPLPNLSAQSKTSLRFSRQGQTIAIDPGDYTVQVWNWQTDQKIIPVVPSTELLSFTLSPDGQTLATTAADGTVQIWDGQTGKQLAEFQASGPVRKLDLSPDGKTLATATEDGMVQLWDWQTGQERTKLPPTRQVSILSFSPDGTTLATATDDGMVQVWDWQTGQQIAQLRPTGSVSSLSFSPDGTTLATVLEDGTLRLWPLGVSAGIAQFGPLGPVLSLSFSPDGQRVATASLVKTAHLWDTRGQALVTLSGHQAPVTSIAFSPDGQRVATASADNTARLWDTRGRALVTLKGHQAPVTSVAFSPDGQRVATASADNTARFWDTRGKELATLTGHQSTVTSVAFSPDGQRVATASLDNTARLWDARGQLLATLKGHQSTVTSIAFSPDGQRVATASADNTARFWDTEGNLLATLPGVFSIAFSPDGQQVVTASLDNTARFWDTEGNLLATLPGVFSIAFSPDGQRLATASADGVVRIWPVELKDLLDLGCQWLEPYLESHPDERKDLPCPSKINPS